MDLVKLQGSVDPNGRVTVQLPWEAPEGSIEVFVAKKKPDISPEEHKKIIDRLFGSIPDMERPPQGDLGPPVSLD